MVTVASLVHWYGRINFGNLNAEKRYWRQISYPQSKVATLVLMHTMQRRLQRSGSSTISVGAHPGITQSELARHSRFLNLVMPLVGQTTEKGALSPLVAAVSPEVQGGDYIGPRGLLRGAPHVARSSGRARSETIGDRLWDVAQDLTGVRWP